jgi:hypothetical protein
MRLKDKEAQRVLKTPKSLSLFYFLGGIKYVWKIYTRSRCNNESTKRI